MSRPAPYYEEEEQMSFGKKDENSVSCKHIFYGVFGSCLVVFFVFILTQLILTAELKKEIESNDLLNPVVQPNTISTSYLEYLMEASSAIACSNKTSKMSTSPLSVCEDMCEQEFCTGSYSKSGQVCRGECYPLKDLNVDKCIRSCLCCQANMVCLLNNDSDHEKCSELLPECSFSNTELPTQDVHPICYPMLSTNYCKNVGIGFNNPVKCLT